jgi:hypothetical protein
LPAGLWTKCPESEATHSVNVDYAIGQSLRSKATWYIKRIKTAETTTPPLELISQTTERTRSGEILHDKCESVFSLVVPPTPFPASPFLLSVSMKWQSGGKSGEFSRLLEIRESLTPDIPENDLKLTVSYSELKGR